MDEDISALRNPTPTPGETTHSHGEAGSDDKDINNLKQTPEQKVDPAENAAGSKRRPRTPKRKEQPLEELAGFTELLQTPDRTLEPVTYDKTQIPCRSPQVDPVITSTIVTKGLKTLLQKVDVEEALLALRKSPRAPGKTTCSPREPAGDEKVIEFFQATPELKLDPAENAAGSRRIPRTPKRKVQHLEDLAGFRELFQSPDRTLEPVTDVKTKTPCKSPQAEPVTTSTGRKSRLKTSLGKVDVEEDISALKNPKPTPGETTRSHGEAGSEDKDISHLKQTPEQKVDPVENAAGSKRRPRTPKRKEQPLEELAGFTELLQTPDRTLEPVTDDKTNNIPSRSPKPEPINTNRKSHLKTPLEKVDIEEELSAPRKPTPTPGGTTHLPGEPGDDKEIKVFKATPEQKLDPAENAARSKRRPRTPKRKVQSLGDLTGFTELLQTPDRTLEPVTDDKTQIPCRSPQVDPVITSTIVTKGLKTLLQKVDVEEALLALRKSPRAPGKTTCSPREPAGDEKVIEFFQATPEQKLDPAENAAGSRRRPRTPKRKVQHLEDLAGFRELFQTPDRTLEPVTDVKTKTPCKSPQAEPVTMSTGRKSRLKTSLGKVDVEEDISALRNPTPTPGETTHSHREAGGDDKDISHLKQTPEQKVDPAENAARSKRRPRTPKRRVQSLGDLTGFRELFQSPDRTLEPVTDVKTKIPCRSPQAEPLSTSTVMTRGLKTLLQKVDVEEALSALGKSPRAPGGTTCSPREPAGDEKITKAFKATPEQKLELTENVTGS
ncbi:proliferation marker protein Ki-67-like, partial [Pteropus medius]|uniref:proliferation marker protein Ki-67-like n=1 Tax=Pteropus vampyrus TaxID=132908 RepID=UPI00196A7858